MDLKGDELISFGFKRIVEEIQALRKETEKTNETLVQISKAVRAAASTAEKTEHNTFIANDTLIQMANALANVQNNTFATEMSIVRINQKLSKEDEHGSELEGI